MIYAIDSTEGKKAKELFLQNLKWCADDLDVKISFRIFAKTVGYETARKLTESRGFKSSYYFQ